MFFRMGGLYFRLESECEANDIFAFDQMLRLENTDLSSVTHPRLQVQLNITLFLVAKIFGSSAVLKGSAHLFPPENSSRSGVSNKV